MPWLWSNRRQERTFNWCVLAKNISLYHLAKPVQTEMFTNMLRPHNRESWEIANACDNDIIPWYLSAEVYFFVFFPFLWFSLVFALWLLSSLHFSIPWILYPSSTVDLSAFACVCVRAVDAFIASIWNYTEWVCVCLLLLLLAVCNRDNRASPYPSHKDVEEEEGKNAFLLFLAETRKKEKQRKSVTINL